MQFATYRDDPYNGPGCSVSSNYLYGEAHVCDLNEVSESNDSGGPVCDGSSNTDYCTCF